MKVTARLWGRGRVTIPIAVRESLDVEDGDVIELDVRRVSEEIQ